MELENANSTCFILSLLLLLLSIYRSSSLRDALFILLHSTVRAIVHLEVGCLHLLGICHQC